MCVSRGDLQGVFQEDDGMTTSTSCGWPHYNDSFCAHMPAVYEHPFPLPVQQPATAMGAPADYVSHYDPFL